MSIRTIELPELRLIETAPCGSLIHVVENRRTAQVVAVDSIKVSARRSEQLWTLDSGERIVLTDRRNLELPDGVDGILCQTGAHSGWLAHKKIIEIRDRIDKEGWRAENEAIRATWRGRFQYQKEQRREDGALLEKGLRPPQYGALHAIAARWSVDSSLATVVMPTGTGKTETMLATLVAESDGIMLVVVPTRALKEQTVGKFETLGLLRFLGCLGPGVRNPIVAKVLHQPGSASDVEFLTRADVIIGNIQAIGQGPALQHAAELARHVRVLVVDEAHHVAAPTWNEFRSHFSSRKVLQFTATPYRRDGELVDGDVIFSYPLSAAQRDGYFKPINFIPVHEIDDARGDVEIARAAIGRLTQDLEAGLDHLVMARCDSIERAKVIHEIYSKRAAKYLPILVHSKLDSDAELAKLKARQSRIVVCVDMLGEGFDLPNLKVAAVHDTHKSLAVLLQFTGRFTRVAGANVGDATVIANIANQGVSAALERLYSEDADWNKLLRELSSAAMQTHHEFIEFLSASKRLDRQDDNRIEEISNSLLRPKFSAIAFSVGAFEPDRFFQGLGEHHQLGPSWQHTASQTLYFVTKQYPPVEWTRSRDLRDLRWDLHVVHHATASRLLFVYSSDKNLNHLRLARAVSKGTAMVFEGDAVFRVLGGINRLTLQTVGVKKYGRRNLRYAMYTGTEVQNAMTQTEKTGSVKSNLAGSGWENGKLVRLGCSAKGRMWSPVEAGTIPQLTQWCDAIGAKLRDDTIDTASIIKNVLIPRSITALPGVPILSIEWPIEMFQVPEERVVFSWQGQERSLWAFEITSSAEGRSATGYTFGVCSDGVSAGFRYELGPQDTFSISQVSGPDLSVAVGRHALSLAEYFGHYPPLIRFVDLSELDGPMLLAPDDFRLPSVDESCFEVWDWAGTQIMLESMWRDGVRRAGSIQERVAKHFTDAHYDVVFDDDGAGEAADLVCLKDHPDQIHLSLVHCKFSGGDAPGERVKDVVEVCSQAVRSAKRIWRFRDLYRHVLRREKDLPRPTGTRFVAGSGSALTRILQASRFKKVVANVVIVQPGLSMKERSEDQNLVLAATQTFLKQTVDVELSVICSA